MFKIVYRPTFCSLETYIGQLDRIIEKKRKISEKNCAFPLAITVREIEGGNLMEWNHLKAILMSVCLEVIITHRHLFRTCLNLSSPFPTQS